ncbi:hypothetical protein L9F63_018094, partial [Diploptera punctata]
RPRRYYKDLGDVPKREPRLLSKVNARDEDVNAREVDLGHDQGDDPSKCTRRRPSRRFKMNVNAQEEELSNEPRRRREEDLGDDTILRPRRRSKMSANEDILGDDPWRLSNVIAGEENLSENPSALEEDLYHDPTNAREDIGDRFKMIWTMIQVNEEKTYAIIQDKCTSVLHDDPKLLSDKMIKAMIHIYENAKAMIQGECKRIRRRRSSKVSAGEETKAVIQGECRRRDEGDDP